MRLRWYERGMIGCVAVLALGLALQGTASELRSMRIDPTADFTRVTFELSGPLEYKLFTITDPDRIVLDLHDAHIAAGFAAPGGEGLLKGVRTGQRQPGDLRVVFDLEQRVRPQSFLLPPNEDGGYRLVVDLYKKDRTTHTAVKSLRTLEAKPRDVVIAIDAGHGGVDPGAIGSHGAREKTITLAVARELKRRIDREPGMTAVLIRDGDYFLPLKERYQKARAAKADLFVSIHADAYTSGDASGSSVWMLSPRGASSEAARWLAERENRADLVGGVSLEDKDDTLAAVLLDLSQSATLEASGAVAEHVLRALAKIGPTHRGYVEKANFVVLRSPDVPSILVETAFITNPNEERRLTNPAQQERLAGAILDGVREYFRATPPPGSWFAANVRKDKPVAAARASVEASLDERSAARAPSS